MSVSAETRQEEIQVLDESPQKPFEIVRAWRLTSQSHTTPAMSTEPISSETPGSSSEPMNIVQPSETVTPVKPTEKNQRADEMNELVYGLLKKVSYIEKRLMFEDIKPHEYIRMIMEAISTFRPDQDATWALRRMRDVSLAYWRVLRKTYLTMKSEECGHLVRLLLFEA